MTIQAENLRLFRDIKVKSSDPDLNHANFCNVKVSGGIASADIKASVSYRKL